MKQMCRNLLIMILILGMVGSLMRNAQAEELQGKSTLVPVVDPDEFPAPPELPELPGEIPLETFPVDTEITGYDGDISWHFDGNHTLTISGNGAMRDYEYNNRPAWYSIRDRIENLVVEEGVTHIGNQAFQFCGNLKEAALSDSIRSIGGNAFWCCESLMTIELPNQLERIGVGAFLGCNKLQSVHIPSRVSNIEEQAFNQCSQLHCIDVDASNPYYRSIDGVLLNKAGTVLLCYPAGKPDSVYQVPEGVAEIDSYVFDCCYNLVEINFPESVRVIGDCAFNHCEILERITLREGLERIGFRAFMHCHGLKEIILPASVKEIGDYAFDWCNGLVRIDVCSGNTFYTSEDGVLLNLQKTRLIRYPANKPGASYAVPASVTRVENSAFALNTELLEIEMPRRVAEIRGSAFYACSGLQKVYFHGNVPEIADDVFLNTNLTAYYPENNATWTAEVFQNYGGKVTWQSYTPAPRGEESGTCGENLVWKLDRDGNMVISGSGAMDDYSYGDKTPWAVYREQITKVVISDGITSIGRYAFGDCSNLKSVVLPGTLKSIGGGAFWNAGKLTEVTIPNSVTELGAGCFSSCGMLEAIALPDGITEIPHGCFSMCTSLKDVTFPKNLETIGADAFEGCTGLTVLAMPDGLKYIESCAFLDCPRLSSLEIPDSVTSIAPHALGYYRTEDWTYQAAPDFSLSGRTPSAAQAYALENGFAFTSTGPSSSGNAGNQLSGRCGEDVYWNLTDGVLRISGSGDMTDYGDSIAFPIPPWGRDGESITSIVVEEGVTRIGDVAFWWLENVRSVTVAASVREIGDNAFYGNESLQQMTFLGSPIEVGPRLFAYCTKLQEIRIPEGITKMPERMFDNCKNLRTIYIPESVTQVELNAFQACESLTDVYFAGTKEQAMRIQYAAGNMALVSAQWHYLKPSGNFTTFVLPRNLTTIQAEAFAGSGAEMVIIPAGVNVIESRAFADCRNLQVLVFEDSPYSIAPDFLAGCSGVTIRAARGTSAERWARANGFAVEYP